MKLGCAITAAGGKDLFVTEILEYMQEAIDGGYSQTKILMFLYHPEKGVIEMRGTDGIKVCTEAATAVEGVTRVAMCRQRTEAPEHYIMQLQWLSPLLAHLSTARAYPMPLLDGKFIEASPGELRQAMREDLEDADSDN
jgi:hypothetical protein